MPARALPPDDDLPLLRRVAAGDADALEALYDRHTPLLYTLALRVAGSPAAAEDALRAAWAQAWGSARAHDPARGRVATWLLGLARAAALERRGERLAAGAMPSSGPVDAARAADPASTPAERQQHQRVLLALQRLDPHVRQVLEGAFFDGLAQGALAERHETSRGTVAAWARRGLLKLRELLPEERA